MKKLTAFTLAAAIFAIPANSFAQGSMTGGSVDQKKGPDAKTSPSNPSSATSKTGETSKDKMHNDKGKMKKK